MLPYGPDGGLKTPTAQEGVVPGTYLLVYAGDSPAETLHLPGSMQQNSARIIDPSQEPE